MTVQFSLNNIAVIAKEILNTFPDKKKFAFYGTMGSGKTTFIKELCLVLGVLDEISSPTYAIIQEYIGNFNKQQITIAHMDWYRLEKSEDIISTGIQEYLNNENIYCFVEWPSVFEFLIDETFIKIELSFVEGNQRIIKVN